MDDLKELYDEAKKEHKRIHEMVVRLSLLIERNDIEAIEKLMNQDDIYFPDMKLGIAYRIVQKRLGVI